MIRSSQSRPARVHVVDEDAADRRAVRDMLGRHGYRAESWMSAALLMEQAVLDESCVLVDLRLRGMTAHSLLERLAGDHVPAIALTEEGNLDGVVEAMRIGAGDVLEKPVCEEVLIGALDALWAHHERARVERKQREAAQGLVEGLTDRERDVLCSLLGGRTNKETALRLGISVRTVEMHRAAIGPKLGASSPLDVVTTALRAGVEPDRD